MKITLDKARELLEAMGYEVADQAEQEPVIKYPGCAYCNDELFCGRKCKCCGKIFIEDEDFVQSEVKNLRQQVAVLKAVLDAWNNVEQEPIGEVDPYMDFLRINWKDDKHPPRGTKLYAAPVRTKDLTDDEICKANKTELPDCQDLVDFARAVIAADREKNK